MCYLCLCSGPLLKMKLISFPSLCATTLIVVTGLTSAILFVVSSSRCFYLYDLIATYKLPPPTGLECEVLTARRGLFLLYLLIIFRQLMISLRIFVYPEA